MKLWLLIATAFLSAVGASHLSGKAWREANDQQDEGQDDYSDGTLQNFAAPQQGGSDDYDFAELERYNSELPSNMESDFAGLQQDSEEDESEGDLGEMQQDGDSDDEDTFAAGTFQQDGEDDDYDNELKVLLQQEGDYDDEDDTKAIAVATQDGDEEGGEDGTAVAQWNNRWDGPLHVRCRAGYGLYSVYSIFNAGRRDRLFNWRCKRVLPTSMIKRKLRPILQRMRNQFLQQQCQRKSWHAHLGYRRWYYKRIHQLRHYYYHRRYLRHTNCFARKINTWDRPMNFRCPTHYYLTGLRSYHNNGKEDRVWTAYCCRTPGVCRRSCRWSGYVNKWRTPMRFRTGGVFTGLYSFHSNRQEDRLWKIQYCYSRTC